jgi:hypothetical protein
MTNLYGGGFRGNGTVVLDPATIVPSLHGDVVFCNVAEKTKCIGPSLRLG